METTKMYLDNPDEATTEQKRENFEKALKAQLNSEHELVILGPSAEGKSVRYVVADTGLSSAEVCAFIDSAPDSYGTHRSLAQALEQDKVYKYRIETPYIPQVLTRADTKRKERVRFNAFTRLTNTKR